MMKFIFILLIIIYACSPKMNYYSHPTSNDRKKTLYRYEKYNQKQMNKSRHTKLKHRKSFKIKAKYS